MLSKILHEEIWRVVYWFGLNICKPHIDKGPVPRTKHPVRSWTKENASHCRRWQTSKYIQQGQLNKGKLHTKCKLMKIKTTMRCHQKNLYEC